MKKLLALLLAVMMIAGVFAGCGPVSYTHLDVYKRQIRYTVSRKTRTLVPKKEV